MRKESEENKLLTFPPSCVLVRGVLGWLGDLLLSFIKENEAGDSETLKPIVITPYRRRFNPKTRPDSAFRPLSHQDQ